MRVTNPGTSTCARRGNAPRRRRYARHSRWPGGTFRARRSFSESPGPRSMTCSASTESTRRSSGGIRRSLRKPRQPPWQPRHRPVTLPAGSGRDLVRIRGGRLRARSALLELLRRQLVAREELVEIGAVAPREPRGLAHVAAGDLQDLREVAAGELVARLVEGGQPSWRAAE